MAAMQQDGYHNTFRPLEPGLTGIGTEPPFAIAQRALLVQTEQGNVLWECESLLDDDTVAAIQRLGGIAAIAHSRSAALTSIGRPAIISGRFTTTRLILM